MRQYFLSWLNIFYDLAPKGPTDNKSLLIHVMAWRRTGDKPLPASMMTDVTAAHMHHEAPIHLHAELSEFIKQGDYKQAKYCQKKSLNFTEWWSLDGYVFNIV